MARPSYPFLRVSVVIFKVLAWVALVLQVAVGLYALIVGGEPVFLWGVTVPMRILGILNFVSAAVYFFVFRLASHLIRLWLDIADRLPAGDHGEAGASVRAA
jgi:hypothetical protein